MAYNCPEGLSAVFFVNGRNQFLLQVFKEFISPAGCLHFPGWLPIAISRRGKIPLSIRTGNSYYNTRRDSFILI